MCDDDGGGGERERALENRKPTYQPSSVDRELLCGIQRMNERGRLHTDRGRKRARVEFLNFPEEK